MSFYFNLQYKRLSRWLAQQGVNPYLGIVLCILAFCLVTEYLFYKTDFATFIYCGILFSLLSGLSSKKRIDPLKKYFQLDVFRKIRYWENAIMSLPFMVFLVIHGEFIAVAVVFIVAFIMSHITMIRVVPYKIPTPFYKIPFEFIVGFRKTFWLYLCFAYILYKAIEIDNTNLGLSMLIACGLTCVSYYFKPESEYFVWIYDKNVNAFLWHKIKVGLFQSSMILLPFSLAAGIFFFEKLWIIALIVFVVYFLIITIILAKYSAFPKEMNLPQGVLFALSVLFPPFILLVIPIFYKQAKNTLNKIL